MVPTVDDHPTTFFSPAPLLRTTSRGPRTPPRHRARSQDRARAEDASRVERDLDPPGQRHHVVTELVGKCRLLRAARAVLARDRAAEADGGAHDVVEGRPGPTLGVRVTGRVDDDGV